MPASRSAAALLTIQVQNGPVRLTGQVEWVDEIRRVVDAARSVPGVVSVSAGLAVAVRR